MELIDKSALVAEIEKLQTSYSRVPTYHDYTRGLKKGRLIGYKDVLYKINNLEIKEVDFEKEYKEFIDCDNGRSMFETAKYFFELGLKAQKGE